MKKVLIYVLMFVMLAFSSLALTNLSVDFTQSPDYVGASCSNGNVNILTSSSSSYANPFDTSIILSPSGDSCIIPQTQIEQDIYLTHNVRRHSSTGGYRGRYWYEFFNYKNASQEGLYFGTLVGGCVSNYGYATPSLIVDFGSDFQANNQTNFSITYHLNADDCASSSASNVNFVFMDENGFPVYTMGNNKINGITSGALHKDGLISTEPLDVGVSSFTDGYNTTSYATTGETINFRYLAVHLRNGNLYPVSSEVTEINIDNIVDPCEDLNASTNSSILSSIFQDYFNYSVPYFCNGWYGSELRENIPNGTLNFNLTDTLHYLSRDFSTTETTLTYEFDFNLTNLQGFGFGLVNKNDSGSQFLESILVSGNTLYVNSLAKYTSLTTTDNFKVKIEHFSSSENINIYLYKNGVQVYSDFQLSAVNTLGANSFTIFSNLNTSLFEIDNLIIYKGTEKEFDNSLIVSNIVQNNQLTEDVGSKTLQAIDDMGFKTSTSKIIFWFIFMFIGTILIIVALYQIAHQSGNNVSPNAVMFTVILVNIVLLFLGYFLTIIPFWIIFLMALFVFGAYALMVSGGGSNVS